MNNNQECHWHPTLAISVLRCRNSNIRTLNHFTLTERKDLFMQYSKSYNGPFWLFESAKNIILVEWLQRHTVMKHLNNLRWWLFRLQCVTILSLQLLVVVNRLQNSVNHQHWDFQSPHQAVQHSHCRKCKVFMEITRAVIIATSTRTQ